MLSAAGFAFVSVVGDLEQGDALIDRALVLNPNLASTWFISGLAKAFLGESEIAIERHARHALESP